MKIKKGVTLLGIRPELLLGILVVDPIIESFNQETVVTSCTDSTHNKGSRHYSGLAVDFRTWTMTNPEMCVRKMREALGDNYDVVLEKDHIHMEYDPE